MDNSKELVKRKHKFFKKCTEYVGMAILRVFIVIELPLKAVEELLKSGAVRAFFEPLGRAMEKAGPISFLFVAFTDFLKWCAVLYRVSPFADKDTRRKEHIKLKRTGYLNLIHQPLFVTGIALLVATLLSPGVGQVLSGSVLILVGASLGAVRYIMKAWQARKTREQELKVVKSDFLCQGQDILGKTPKNKDHNDNHKVWNNTTKAFISTLIVVAFGLFLFPVGLELASVLTAMSAIYVLVTLVPNISALWQDRREKNLSQFKRTVHAGSVALTVVGIALSIAAIAVPPLAFAGFVALGLVTVMNLVLHKPTFVGKQPAASNATATSETKPLLFSFNEERQPQTRLMWEKQRRRSTSEDDSSDNETDMLLDDITCPPKSSHRNTV